jgi:hypothetical protein
MLSGAEQELRDLSVHLYTRWHFTWATKRKVTSEPDEREVFAEMERLNVEGVSGSGAGWSSGGFGGQPTGQIAMSP